MEMLRLTLRDHTLILSLMHGNVFTLLSLTAAHIFCLYSTAKLCTHLNTVCKSTQSLLIDIPMHTESLMSLEVAQRDDPEVEHLCVEKHGLCSESVLLQTKTRTLIIGHEMVFVVL